MAQSAVDMCSVEIADETSPLTLVQPAVDTCPLILAGPAAEMSSVMIVSLQFAVVMYLVTLVLVAVEIFSMMHSMN